MKKTIFSALTGVSLLALTIAPALAKPAVRSLTGGGEIADGGNKISFGGNIKDLDALKGQFEVNFHNVSNPDVSGGKFHSTEITAANWYEGSGDCKAAMNVYMDGKFNGQDGYQLIFRAGDDEDTVRFTLSGHGLNYDTHSGDFDNESHCIGTARTGLDNGNLTIRL